MPDTPNLGLPYPILANDPDVPRDIQALAEAIDVLNLGRTVGDFKYSFQAADHADWLLCDGVARDRADLPAPYLALIDATMGVHPDPLKVRTPNGRRRFLAGANPGGALFAGVTPNLAAIGGEETHLLTGLESGVNGDGHTTAGAGHAHSLLGVVPHLPRGHFGFAANIQLHSPPMPLDITTAVHPLLEGPSSEVGDISDTDSAGVHSHPLDWKIASAAHNNLPPFLLANLFIATTTVGGGLGVGGSGGATGLESRTVLQKVTGALAVDTHETGAVALPRGCHIIRVTADKACRVRLYMTAADRDAVGEAARVFADDPVGDHGVLLDVEDDAAPLSIRPIGALASNFDAPVADLIYYRVTQLAGAGGAITVTFTHVRSEG